MTFSQFCDMAENTEQEQKFFESMKDDEMSEAAKQLGKLTNFPFVGKLCAAFIALANSESLESFRQSPHFENLKDFNFEFDSEKKSLKLTPGDVHKEKIKRAAKAIGVGVAVFTICRLLRRCCSRSCHSCCNCKK